MKKLKINIKKNLMGLSVNILTSGFLVTVIIFFVLMGFLFYSAATKMGEVLLTRDNRSNNLEQLDSAYNSVKVAFILAWIAAAITLLLAILYAGHELVINPSEFWHLALYLITYVLLIVSVVYAFIALSKLYTLGIVDRNGADAYIWAGLLMSIFAFIGLTATGSGRLGMNIVRSDARKRLEKVEANINEHLPAVRAKVEQAEVNIAEHLPITRAKIDELHAASFVPQPFQAQVEVGSPYVSNVAPQQVLSSLSTQYVSSPTQYGTPAMRPQVCV